MTFDVGRSWKFKRRNVFFFQMVSSRQNLWRQELSILGGDLKSAAPCGQRQIAPAFGRYKQFKKAGGYGGAEPPRPSSS